MSDLIDFITFDLGIERVLMDDEDPADTNPIVKNKEDRFPRMSKEEVQQVAAERTEKTTNYVTTWGVKVLKGD